MNGTYGIATPKSDENRQKMAAKIGRDHFFFKADPTDCVIQTAHGNIPALRWDFTALDPMIRICLTVEASRLRKVSIKEAQRSGSISDGYGSLFHQRGF